MNDVTMKLLVKPLVIATISIFSGTFLFGNDLPSDLPKGAWDVHAEGVALALSFKTQKDAGTEKSSLSIYLKNTSVSTKEFYGDFIAYEVEILDISGGGKWRPLRISDPFSITRGTRSSIEPGKTDVCPIELSPEESKLIRSNSVRFHMAVYDDTSKQSFNITTPPRKLDETVINAPH